MVLKYRLYFFLLFLFPHLLAKFTSSAHECSCSLSILACISALMYSTELGPSDVFGFFFLSFEGLFTLDLSVDGFVFFHFGLISVHFWLGYFVQIYSLELFLLFSSLLSSSSSFSSISFSFFLWNLVTTSRSRWVSRHDSYILFIFIFWLCNFLSSC